MNTLSTILSALLPFLCAIGVILWFLQWVSARRGTRMPRGIRGWTRADGIAVALITVGWAILAFSGLGDTDAPQSFLHFTDANQYAEIELNEPAAVSAIRYYSGLNTADYRLELSQDGEVWFEQRGEDGASGMTQTYVQLFRWNDASIDTGLGPIRCIRIYSGAEEWLGELALYGEDGALIPVSALTIAPGCEALFDEQDCVPDASSYKNGTYFDEIYHARTAFEHLESVWPYEITHPPLGKLILGLGIRLFGMTPFGWRFSGTLMGVLMLPALYFFLKKLFDDTVVCICGTLVFAFDFMHFTQCRIATIDSYVTLFILLMYLFMWLWLTEKRPLWLALCGISFGLGAASKWTGFYAGAGLALLWLYDWVRRFIEDREGFWRELGKNILFCLLFFVAVPALIYYLSYYAYGTAQGMHGLRMFFSRDYLRTVLDNQKYMWEYHSQLVAEHPYSSKWYQWLVDARPILYYLDYAGDGSRAAIAAFNDPLLSWSGLAAILALAVLAVRERDKTAAFIVFGWLVNLAPWIPVSRLTFAYHYFPCTIFLALAVAYLMRDLRQSGLRWRGAVFGYTGACAGLFALFYPVLSGVFVSGTYCDSFLHWFSTWPL